jgi:hypothetical protein
MLRDYVHWHLEQGKICLRVLPKVSARSLEALTVRHV